ncbi:PRC and DUF2382 domain-containing protein [Actinomadura sp. 21ATH]|uniref:PRC and DUF2382 domain-containing protein n=1 Tax=Actinomadura sp. 21ATH TaxID=1735444 RepID=UPI0035C1DE07
MQTQTNVKELMDCDVTDSSGHKCGTVKQVYLNDVTGEPEWVRVHTGWFGTRESFVPLSDARRTRDGLQIPYDKDKVKHAPNVDADQHLSREQVTDLYGYYGLRPPTGRQPNVPGQQPRRETGEARGTKESKEALRGGPVAGEQSAREHGTTRATPTAGTTSRTDRMQTSQGKVAGERTMAGDRSMAADRTADDGMVEMTLSEERLRVGTERHEAERVRLRKRVEVERIERTVPVYREELRIEREPIAEGELGDAAGRFRIGEDEREFILHEERPMITKETVPVERVRVRAERIASEQTVRDEIRKERIDFAHESDAAGRRRGQGGESGRHERR